MQPFTKSRRKLPLPEPLLPFWPFTRGRSELQSHLYGHAAAAIVSDLHMECESCACTPFIYGVLALLNECAPGQARLGQWLAEKQPNAVPFHVCRGGVPFSLPPQAVTDTRSGNVVAQEKTEQSDVVFVFCSSCPLFSAYIAGDLLTATACDVKAIDHTPAA
ncbi:hypothetical protein MRX96_032769 [Rhipicephalus microplus]